MVDGYCSKVKAFREQLEKLDEKTLDFATSQEPPRHAARVPGIHQGSHWAGASRDHGWQLGHWAAQRGNQVATADGWLSSAKEVELLVEALNDSNAMPGT